MRPLALTPYQLPMLELGNGRPPSERGTPGLVDDKPHCERFALGEPSTLTDSDLKRLIGLRRRCPGFGRPALAPFHERRKSDRPVIRNSRVAWCPNAHGRDRGIDFHIAGL